MALTEFQKRQLEDQAFAKLGGRKGFLTHGYETAEEETNRKLKQALAMSEEERKKKWEEARAAREAAFARGVQQRKPDTRSLMEAEVAGKILPDVMPDDKFADMNVLPKAGGSQATDPLANLRTKQGYMSMVDAMNSGNIPEQTADRGGAAAQTKLNDVLDRIHTEEAMKKYPGVGNLDNRSSGQIAEGLMSNLNTRMSRTTPGGMNLPSKSSDDMAEEIMSRVQTERSRTTPGMENLDTRSSGEIAKGIRQNVEDKEQRIIDAENIARQKKFDSQNKAERERLFAGLDKQEKALAKEASGKYWIEPVTGYAVNLESLKKHAKRQEIMDIAQHLPAATKVKFLLNEGILDEEDVPKDQKLTLEKEKLRVEIAKLKAQTKEIENKNPKAEMLVDMAGEAFEIGAYDAGFDLLEDAYGEPLPQNISKIFQSIKSKGSKKGGADDIDYTGHWFDPVKTGMPGKDYANRFYNTVRDVRQELTAIRENPLDETSVGKAVNLFAAHGINYQEFIERAKPGSLEYQDMFRKVVEKEVDARLGRPGIYNGVFSGLADDMAQEQAVLDRQQAIADGKPVPVESPFKEDAFTVPDDVADVSAAGNMGTVTPEIDTSDFETQFPRTSDAFDYVKEAAGKSSSLSTEDEIKEDGSINTSIGSFARIMSGQAATKAIAKKLVEMNVDPESNQAKYERIVGGLIPDGLKNWLTTPRNKEVYDQAMKMAINEEKGIETSPQAAGIGGNLQAATLETLPENQMTSGMKKTANYEQFKAKPYKDGDGYSIGHGFHLDKESITKADLQNTGIPQKVKDALLKGDPNNPDLKLDQAQSEKLFRNIYKRRQRETVNTYPWVKDLPEEAKNIVYDMAYNLGKTKFSKFKRFLNNMERGRYKQAAKEIRFTRGKGQSETPYWKQTGNRAKENYEILMRL